MQVTSIHAFAEKVSLITDGNDPVGRAAALQLALQGSYVIVGDPEGEGANGLDDLLEMGTLAFAVNADGASAEGAKALASGVNEKFERLDLLMNVFAGDDADIAAAEGMIKACSRLMEPRPKARIVNVYRLADMNGVERIEASTVRLRDELPAHFQVNSVAFVADAAAPDDVARVVLFLLSGESKAIRGETIKIR